MIQTRLDSFNFCPPCPTITKKPKYVRPKCPHGRQRHTCKECGGASICEHGRARSRCKECGGSQICEHGRQRSTCSICDPCRYVIHLRRHRRYGTTKAKNPTGALEDLCIPSKEWVEYLHKTFEDRYGRPKTDNDKVQIYKVSNNVWELETDDDLTVDTNTWYDVKVVCNHFTGEIRVYVDGDVVTSWTDPNPLLTGNSISLRTGNCVAEYDDIRVYKSRIGAQYINIGTANDPVRYQNPDPNTPSCEIRSIIFDGAGNCSDEDVIQVNIDWTPPVLSGINDGQGVDIDETNDGTQLSANWPIATDPQSGLDQYEVAVGTTPGASDFYPFTNIGLNTDMQVIQNLTPNEWYYTTVKAVNAAGLEEADTSDGQQYIDITVSIEEFMEQSAYPNPTTGIINLPQIENLTWQLFDGTGRLVAEGSGEDKLDLRILELAEQIVSLRLLSNRHQKTLKISYLKE